MKKIGLLYREKAVDLLKENWQGSEACIFVGFNKVGAFAFNSLRNQLKNEESLILVSKNSLIKKALRDLKVSDFESLLSGSTGLVVVNGQDLVKVCKSLTEFSKENEGFSLKGGFLREKKLDEKDLIALSRLPSKDILLAQAVMTIASPLSGFVATLNNIILKFVWAVEELKKKKDSQ